MKDRIEIVDGDILKSEAEAIVNPVNCVGVMGKGLAAQFRAMYPRYFQVYERECAVRVITLGRREGATRNMRLGKVHVFHVTDYPQSVKYIISFPTKYHWRDHSRIEDIKSGLRSLRAEIETRQIKSIAIPALGCGLGGLTWCAIGRECVLPLILGFADRLPWDVEVAVYRPRE